MKIAFPVLLALTTAFVSALDARTPVYASEITYTFDLPTIGGASVTGTITTDGNLGVLTNADIVSWNFTETFTSSGLSFSETPSDSFLVTGPGNSFPFDANATGLSVPSGYGIFYRLLWNDQSTNPHYSSDFEIASSTTAGDGDETVGYILFNYGTGLDQESQIGVAPQYFAIATPTPLPATLPLFAGGLGFVGYLTHRRKRTGRKLWLLRSGN
jgi:hypothetical protein